MRRRTTMLVLAATAALAAVAIAAVAVSQRLDGDGARSATAGADRRLGPTDPHEQIVAGLVLRLPGRDRLARFIRAVEDPRSPQYRRYLSAGEFGRRFGLRTSDLRELRTRVRRLGLSVADEYPQRTTLRVRAPAAVVARAFGVRLDDWRTQSGRRFHRPAGSARVPPPLARLVEGIAGLDNRPQDRRPKDVPAAGLSPQLLARAFDIKPLWDQGMRGEGQTVAILSFSSFKPSDVALFDREVGRIGGPPVQRVPVSGGTDDTTSDNVEENMLDIDTVRAVAPKAQIINYEGSEQSTQADVINRVVQDGRAKILSDSYGHCDVPGAVTPADRAAHAQAVQAATAAGISILFASGDAGAYDCQHNDDPSNTRLAIDFPGGFAGMTVVGGTRLSVRADNTYLEETAWSDPLERSGSGGGVAPADPRPPWQTGPGVSNSRSNGRRQMPDVAAPGDPNSGYRICFQGACDQSVGGTSGGAPFWAGSLAVVAQYLDKQGAGKLGFVNPLLYKLGSTDQTYPPYHDVTRGNNRFYDATPGWDFATGWGSPDVYNFARDVAEQLK